ncbi:M23 family metallopeptidase [uncultured Bacteroides sp.]|uniref:M23 family metallopeptidase n=1 Tax=uncultured Bacteroides sp. TaxID=162156 RepID=UPI002AABE33E|nr:M23 family metallopeptidase [uncultured Bacteroides sp.]
MKKYIVALLLSTCIDGHAQAPANATFTPPLETPLTLSGNFGELRPNHFHGGLDFKTGNVIGKKVLASSDGYISRILVTHGSGHLLYVHYNNGYTAIYRHLSGFVSPIAERVEAFQYAHESWTADITPHPEEYPVHSGQQIAWSGNAGYSFGPHLHLDLVEDSTGDRVDPLLFFKPLIKDNRAPKANGIILFPQPGRGVVEGSDKNKRFLPNALRPIEAWGWIGSGIKAYDYMSGTSNHYGVYSVMLKVDGKEIFRSTVDRYSMDENRMINSWTYGNYMKSFIDPGNTLRMLSADKTTRGLIDINEERDYHFMYELKDFYGNTSRYRFVVQGKRQPIKPLIHREKYHFVWNEVNYLQEPGMTLFVPKGTLYNDLSLSFNVRADSDAIAYTYQINDESVPLHSACKLSIGIRNKVVSDSTKYYIAQLSENGKMHSVGGQYHQGFITAKVLTLGTYTVEVDTIPPKVVPVNKRNWVRSGKIIYHIKDAETAIRSYRGTIDGRFALFEWRIMTNRLVCKIDRKRINKTGKHSVELVVTDKCGNVKVVKDVF